jgi:hypothetical protein
MKTEYRVKIPVPKAKRMNLKSVVINYGSNWCGFTEQELQYKSGDTEVYFSLDSCYEWVTNSKVIDGDIFEIKAKFENATGSRKEDVRLVPEKISKELL